MDRTTDPALPDDLGAPPLLVQAELERVLAAPAFAGAHAHQRLLRYLVENTLAGRWAQLKETVLGIEVFQRAAGRFDPRRDSIVRVEARRLRERLQRHYRGDSASSEVLIELAKGSYRPRFIHRRAEGTEGRHLAPELVERGLYFLRLGHDDGHRKALERFEAAALADPQLAAAHSGVARAWLQLVATNLEPPRPGIELALAAARRGVALEPEHAESLVMVAQLTHRFEFDWPAARRLFEQAARVAPTSPYVRHAHALALMMRGEFDAAEAELSRARVLDPLHLSLRAHQALLQLYRRQWLQAEDTLAAMLDLSPGNVLGMSLLAYVHLCRDEVVAALGLYQRVAELHPQLSIGLAGVAQALAAAGRGDEARAQIEKLRNEWRGRYLSPYQLAMAEWRLGQRDATLALLERAIEERDPNAICLPVDPAFSLLADDERFNALVARVLGRAPTAGAAPSPGTAPGPAP